MAEFMVEQYELHAQSYRVEADSMAEAVQKVLNGEGECEDNGCDLLENLSSQGLSMQDCKREFGLKFVGQCCELGIGQELVENGVFLPSIRCVEEVY